MTFQDFIIKYNGKGIDFDGYYGDQCMDLMHQYCVDVLGLPGILFAAPTAYQAYQNANDSRFTKIDNSPTGVPTNGDIIFWNTSIGSAGHVAVFINGDANSFTSFDQNWPTGSLCHEQAHNYKGVAGWLHFNQNDTQAIIDELRTARDLNYNNWQDELKKNNDLTKQYQDELTKNQGLREANDNLTKTDADTGAQLLDAQHKANDYNKVLEVLKATDLVSALKAIDALDAPHNEVVKQVQPLLDQLFAAASYKRLAKKTSTLWDNIINILHLRR